MRCSLSRSSPGRWQEVCNEHTGLRASELVNLRCGDVALGSGAHIRCMGKGRKERCTPLRSDTAKLLAAWIGNRSDDDRPLFPSIRDEGLSRDALEHLVRKHCLTASRTCPSLAAKRVTPHTFATAAQWTCSIMASIKR